MSDFTCESVARAALGEPTKREGTELLYCCPHKEHHANGDAHPSLKVNPKKDTWACFVCGANGTAWALAAFIAGVEPSDKRAVSVWLRERGLLNGKRPKGLSHVKREPVAVYEYSDARRNPVARKLRYEPGTDGRPKGFAWQRWENGAWVDGLAGVKTPLYRLPEVLAATDVLIVEGEKDADTGNSLGLTTTTSGAAGSWRNDFSTCLSGKRVTIIADADEPGRKHARQVAESLYGKVESLTTLELPGAKDLSEWHERGGTRDVLLELVRTGAQRKPQSVDGDALLIKVLAFIRRFVSLSESQARVVSLWIAHTYTFQRVDATPYLAITSAEKQCGKSRLLEVLQVLVANPWMTGRVTAAILIRKIDAEQPTLLLDESDAAFAGEKEYAETLRGILNSGHRSSGKASCCVGKGADISYKDFRTFCPKAIAGIGNLPDTVADRSVPIRLKRAAPGEVVERFRLRDVRAQATALKEEIEAWCLTIAEGLPEARPELPDALTDRQQDGAEPLLAIADAAGGDWPKESRRAFVGLCSEAQGSDNSIGKRLLADIWQIFESKGVDRLPSAEFATALAEIETSPWGEWSHGKPLSAAKLASLLKPFEVYPDCIRFGGVGSKTLRGYLAAQFQDAFRRYLRAENLSALSFPAPQGATLQQTNTGAGSGDFSKCNTKIDVAVQECEKPNKDVACCTVALSSPDMGAIKGDDEVRV